MLDKIIAISRQNLYNQYNTSLNTIAERVDSFGGLKLCWKCFDWNYYIFGHLACLVFLQNGLKQDKVGHQVDSVGEYFITM